MNKKTGFTVIILFTVIFATFTSCDQKSLDNDSFNYSFTNLIWSDEFTGNELDTTKWRPMTGIGPEEDYPIYWGNDELQYYTGENAFIRDNQLIIRIKIEERNGMNYTSARLTTSELFSFTYGRVEARIKLPVGTDGIWPAFWMLPNGQPEDWVYGTWAASGEIDIMENRSRTPNQVGVAAHYGGQWPSNTYTAETYDFPAGESTADFNIYTLEWFENEMIWYVNGNEYFRLDYWYTFANDEHCDMPVPFDQPFCLIINGAVGGNFDGGIEPGDEFAEAEIVVDWVRVYQ